MAYRHSDYLWRLERRRYCFYALIDPRDGEIRYIGRSEQPSKRAHVHRKNKHGLKAKREWIAELLAAGLAPQMVTLEEADLNWSDAKRREAELTRQAKDSGARLLNQEAAR